MAIKPRTLKRLDDMARLICRYANRRIILEKVFFENALREAIDFFTDNEDYEMTEEEREYALSRVKQVPDPIHGFTYQVLN